MKIWEKDGKRNQKFMAVDVADVNGNGRAEIFVTSVKGSGQSLDASRSASSPSKPKYTKRRSEIDFANEALQIPKKGLELSDAERSVLALLEDESPDCAVVAVDLPGPTFRDEIDDQYKAHGVKMGDNIQARLPQRYTVSKGATMNPTPVQDRVVNLTITDQTNIGIISWPWKKQMLEHSPYIYHIEECYQNYHGLI